MDMKACRDGRYKRSKQCHCVLSRVLFVDTVDMKIKACNAFNAMFVDTVDTGVCFLCSLCWIVQHQYQMTIRIRIQKPSEDGRLFIWYSKCSTQICIDSVDISPFFCSLSSIVQDQYWKALSLGRGERPLYAEFSHLMEPQTPMSTVSTNIALNALHALIFVSTVSTNKIPYSIHNSIALIFCIDCLNISPNVHTTDKVTVSGFLTI